ncbi:DNA-directed RNA polymerase subunit P [Nanoarchaeota archaeon]|nr:MAG: DNA-directed RNA polymerase subunit P [Nanoarchaeota archaeon]
MTKYVCFYCGREIDPKELGKKIRCPQCGGKVLFKVRPKIIKKVKAV